MGWADQPARIAVLTAGLLVAFGGVSLGGIEVGSSRGGGAGSWVWERARSQGCRTVHREIEHGYQETFRAEGHVDVDIAEVPGVTLGGAAGYMLTDVEQQGAVWDLDEASGMWELTESSDRAALHQRYWLGLRVGYQNRFVQARGMLGIARLVSTNAAAPDVHPVLRTELAVGYLGVAAYSNRFEWMGGPDLPTLAHEFSLFHGAALLGGDLPAVEVGIRVGRNPQGSWDPRVEVRYLSPAHWRVQPWISGNASPTEPSDHWSVDAGIQLLFGRRDRFSVRHPRPPPDPPEPPDPDEPEWDEG